MSLSIKGVVKNVTSGDTLVVKHPKKQLEKYINLAGVEAPRFNKKEEKDESYGFAAREFVRKACIGKSVEFTVKYSNPKRRTDYCDVIVDDNSLSKLLLENGLAKISAKAIEDGDSELIESEETGRQNKKGLHSGTKDLPPIERTNIEATSIFKTIKNRTLDVVVEHVISGSTIKVLLPTFEIVQVSFTGVKTPNVKFVEKDGQKEKKFEPYAKDAKAYTETLLGKDVQIIFEGLDVGEKYTDILGTVLVDKKPFSEGLFEKGLAKINDNTVGNSKFISQFRTAEKKAQSEKTKIWKDYKPISSTLQDGDQNLISGKLVDIISGDTVKLLLDDKEEIVSLSNVRSRSDDKDSEIVSHWNIEAKEFLRKRLVGKKLNVKVDYRRKLERKQGEKKIEEERRYVTILDKGKSISVELVSAGLAVVQKYRDQEKSDSYDSLLKADSDARKTKKGMHGSVNKKKGFKTNSELILKGENDKNETKITADASKICITNRDKKVRAVVSRVLNGARFKLYLPDESVTIIFALDGVSAPSLGKDPKPFSKESLLFAQENLYLRDVNVYFDRLETKKGLTFIGSLFLNDKDFALDLLNQGLGTLTKSASKLKNFEKLQKAEVSSRAAKRNIFSIEQEERKPSTNQSNNRNGIVQGNTQVFAVRVTEIDSAGHLYLQTPDSAELLEKVDSEMKLLNLDESEVDKDFKPKVKELVLAKFSEDKCWYRAQILSNEKQYYTVFYIDFGNKEKVKVSALRKLDQESELAKIKPQAKEAYLAYVHFHGANFKTESLNLVQDFCQGEDLVARHEYSLGKNIYVSLFDSKGKFNLNADLIVNGFAFVTNNYHLTEGPQKDLFEKQLNELRIKQQEAKNEKSGLWADGDVYDSDEE
eukprot:gene4341-7697_t